MAAALGCKERIEVDSKNCWDVEALYPSWQTWEEELKAWTNGLKAPYFPKMGAFKGTLHESSQVLSNCIRLTLEIERKLSALYTYAHLRHDEDVASEKPKTAYMTISSILNALRQETAWIEPEILSIADEKLKVFLTEEPLKDLRVYLEKILRLKAHTLSTKEEELLALGADALETAERAFSSFNNADLKFEPVKDSKGNMRELTHGSYQVYLKDADRTLREGAFKSLHRAFLGFENTCAELLNGQVQRHLFGAKARKFPSCVEGSLFPHQIDVSVYTALIKAVHEHLPEMHRYLHLRKKLLGYPTLHLYDLNVPLAEGVKIEMDYESAVQEILESLSVMGPEYVQTVKEGLLEKRWVDRYENKRKRSGAYSSGCYDSMPYILMNYHGTFNDVMTLTHETGHSMHSFYSRKGQPYQYSQYGIFLAEVASTFHEELLLQHFLKKAKDPKTKAYLITQQIDALRATLIRQTLFAEFELKIHTLAENKVPLTAPLLKEEYRKLNSLYFGDAIVLDSEVDIEWARIPHFYYCFYVYQYATGISAAKVLANAVLKGEVGAKEKYIAFISSGSSLPPLEVLKRAGVNMCEPTAVGSAMHLFKSLIDQLEEVM